MEKLPNKAYENHFFSKIDLKSTYHQVPLKKKEDEEFIALEVGGNHYKFNVLLFELTNVVPAFQRFIHNFGRQNTLERTYHCLENVITWGGSNKENDPNVKAFLIAAEKKEPFEIWTN